MILSGGLSTYRMTMNNRRNAITYLSNLMTITKRFFSFMISFSFSLLLSFALSFYYQSSFYVSLFVKIFTESVSLKFDKPIQPFVRFPNVQSVHLVNEFDKVNNNINIKRQTSTTTKIYIYIYIYRST